MYVCVCVYVYYVRVCLCMCVCMCVYVYYVCVCVCVWLQSYYAMMSAKLKVLRTYKPEKKGGRKKIALKYDDKTTSSKRRVVLPLPPNH